MTDIERALYKHGYNTANNSLNEDEYKECFDHWLDAVDGCGVTLEDSEHFRTLLDQHIKEWYIW